jgi:hypothetical protein
MTSVSSHPANSPHHTGARNLARHLGRSARRKPLCGNKLYPHPAAQSDPANDSPRQVSGGLWRGDSRQIDCIAPRHTRTHSIGLSGNRLEIGHPTVKFLADERK